MKLTERQQTILRILLEDVDELGPGSAEEIAIRIDQAVPSLPAPAPTQGHLPPPKWAGIPVGSAGSFVVVVDLDRFYEDVVMPSRERYMARNVGRRAGDAFTP